MQHYISLNNITADHWQVLQWVFQPFVALDINLGFNNIDNHSNVTYNGYQMITGKFS